MTTQKVLAELERHHAATREKESVYGRAYAEIERRYRELARLENAVALVLRHCEAVLPDGYRESGVWRICNEALGQTKGGAK